MLLEIHELINAVVTRKSVDNSGFMLADTPGKIVGNADIERAIALAREDVDVVAIVQRIKPLRGAYPGSRIGAPAKPSLVRDTK